MPQKKLCRCGMLININEKYCPMCAAKADIYKAQSLKLYDMTKRNRDKAAVYHDKQWLIVSEKCKVRFKGICVYSWYVHGNLVYGYISHHIIEVEEDKSRVYDLENLVYLDSGVHNKVHAAYDKSDKDKKEMQALLFELVDRWKREFEPGSLDS